MITKNKKITPPASSVANSIHISLSVVFPIVARIPQLLATVYCENVNLLATVHPIGRAS